MTEIESTNAGVSPTAADAEPLAASAGSPGPQGTEIQISNLDVLAGGKSLLMKATASIRAGKVTLILGCSGVGKSVLLRILAGLITSDRRAIEYSGQIRFVSADGESTPDEDHPVAVVFQSFALFDELSPAQNVQIAMDHCAAGDTSSDASMERATELLHELGVPRDRATSVLSGGQQQRLAIARAIGMETDVVLFDEPTSGLDVNTAAQVADLIRQTQTLFQRTSVVVTHDFQALQRIADHILVLNHVDRTLDELPRERWHELPEILGAPPASDEQIQTPDSILTRLRASLARSLAVTGLAVEETLLLPWALVPMWKSVRWGLRSTWHYLKLVSGWSACVYIAIAGLIIGFVAQDFIFRYLPFRQYTEPLLIENLLHATGFSLYRFLVPMLCTILIAARSGAAVAADVGSKVYGNQMDAMKTIGMNPRRSLRTPILYAFLIGTPFLTMLSYAVASLTSSVAFTATHPDYGIAFWDSHFHKELRLPVSFLYKGTGWLMAKLLTCATGIGMISWHCGASPKSSGPAISKGVTQTILWSTLFVLMVHLVFSLMEFHAAK